MGTAGQSIENPASGERITWRKTTADTDGERLEWEHGFMRAGAHVPRDHIHTKQEERFEVISGRARVRAANDWRELGPGESIIVPPGTTHGLYNAADSATLIRAELLPACNTEAFFETTYGLARDGKVDKAGVPNLLRLAVILRGLDEEHYMPGLPIALQKFGLVLLAPVGRLLGYKACYPEYSGEAP
jgi:mannose-6-phosphate isomerase-like protein (cupin superfamily)